jgi:hypothetical protein
LNVFCPFAAAQWRLHSELLISNLLDCRVNRYRDWYDQKTLIAVVRAGVLNKSAMLASGSEAVLKRLQIAQKVEELVCRVDGPRKNTLKADLHAAVSAKDVNAAVTCLQSPGIEGVTKVM